MPGHTERPTIDELDERVREESRAIRRVYALVEDYHVEMDARGTDSTQESFGSREHDLASAIDDALDDVVSLRDAVGFSLDTTGPVVATPRDAAKILREMIAACDCRVETALRAQHLIESGATGRVPSSDFHSAMLEVVDDLWRRPGYAQCGLCRFEHCFWRSAAIEETCPVCLEPARGTLSPCNHPLCKECFCNMKCVPVTEVDLVTLLEMRSSEYREWAEQTGKRNDYRRKVERRRALTSFLSKQSLCQRCTDVAEDRLKRCLLHPCFCLDELLLDTANREVIELYIKRLERRARLRCC